MQNDSDILEVALIQNMIRTIITNLKDCPQLVYYFNDENDQPYYVLLIAIAPFGDYYSIFRLDNDITFKVRGNLLDLEHNATEILSLEYGKRVLNWVRNIKIAYSKIKAEYYQD
tara:strand:+ start:297 stop:638 length:342 start_codon:yes stop_codon:yes gene_type:complete